MAYKAVDLQDILYGIEEYLDDVTVLPPSIWDPNVRLAPPKTTRTLVSLGYSTIYTAELVILKSNK